MYNFSSFVISLAMKSGTASGSQNSHLRLPSMLLSCSLRDTDSILIILALQQGKYDSASSGQFHSDGNRSIVTCSHHECDQSAISVSTKAASANRFRVIVVS